MEMMEDLIDIKYISDQCKCSYRHTRDRVIKRPGFPVAIKVGRIRQWPKKEFIAWFKKQREH